MSNENPIFHGHNSPSEINADIRNKRSTKSSSILDPVISPSAAALEQKNFEDPYKLVSQPTWLHESLFGPILSLSKKLPVRFRNIVQSLIDKAFHSFTPLSLSPIRPGEQGALSLVLLTPKSSTAESSKAGAVTSTNVESPTPKTPVHPSTPAQFAQKRITQTIMLMNLMKSSANQQQLTSTTLATPCVSVEKNYLVSEKFSPFKLNVSNPGKGKSLMPIFDGKPESSDMELGDEEVGEKLPKHVASKLHLRKLR